MDSRNYEDFDPDYDQIQEPEVDTLLIHLPGFRKDQLRVQLIRTVILRISGERQLEGNKWKRFLKEFQVSPNCDTNRISAKFQSGTLYVTLPKLITTTEGEESEDSESEPTEPENVSDNKGVGAGEETKLDKKAANGKSDEEKSGDAKVDASSIVNHTSAFLSDFAATMVKMRNLASSAGIQLEICDVCSIVTPTSMATM
nr:inactive protein RESTRICTED TEV MOVEMENT 2-like [Ipomoea batatas]